MPFVYDLICTTAGCLVERAQRTHLSLIDGEMVGIGISR